MQAHRAAADRSRAAMRVALSHYITNGMSVAFGLLLISGGMHLWLGTLAASAASVGVIVTAPPDLTAPRRGKFFQMLPAPLIGLPLFFCVQLLHAEPLRLGLLLVPATFFAFLAMAWGKRGIPIAIAVMFSMVFSMATPTPADMHEALQRTLYFGLGAGLYVLYATLANLVLNARYRVQTMADLLLSLSALMRTEARQFTPMDESGDVREIPASLLGRLLREQAALADQLQAARDIVLESPRTPRRQRLAGMLMTVLELRDLLLASELDLDALKAHPGHAATLVEMRASSKNWPMTRRRSPTRCYWAVIQGRWSTGDPNSLRSISMKTRLRKAATSAQRRPCWHVALPAASDTSTTRCSNSRHWRAAISSRIWPWSAPAGRCS